MNCTELESRVHPYVDGELSVTDMSEADAHLAACPGCRGRIARERQFRQLLRQEPRELAPEALRERIQAQLARSARWTAVRRWSTVAAAAAMIAAVALLPGLRSSTSLVIELVDKHIAFTQMEQPAELVSADCQAVETWFRERVALRVTVADYSVVGIRLIGARIAEARERPASYVLYEKGHTPLSVFMVPVNEAEGDLRGRRVAYRGHEYVTLERKGYRTVSWTDGQALFGLVSMLDYDALLECADKLRAERARQARL